MSEAKESKKNWFAKHWILTTLLVIFILGLIGASLGEEQTGESNKTQVLTNSADVDDDITKAKETIKVSAVDLAEEYENNEIRADKSYKDKLVEVTGDIQDMGVVFGVTSITLAAKDDFSITNVQCIIKDETEIEKIASLNKGDNITLQGIVEGKSMNVTINDCIIK